MNNPLDHDGEPEEGVVMSRFFGGAHGPWAQLAHLEASSQPMGGVPSTSGYSHVMPPPAEQDLVSTSTLAAGYRGAMVTGWEGPALAAGTAAALSNDKVLLQGES